MDDEVFKMVNIEGQVGFRRAGFFGGGIFFILYFCFKQQQEAEVPCSQLAKKFRIRGRKKKNSGMGEKRKK